MEVGSWRVEGRPRGRHRKNVACVVSQSPSEPPSGSQASGPRDRGIWTPVRPPKTQAPMQSLWNLRISIPNDPTPGDPRVLPLIHFPKTQASGSGPQHPHLQTSPPRGRGSGPFPRLPRPQPRSSRTRRSCTVRRTPCDCRGGQGALASGWVQPHFHPLLPRRARGGVSTQAHSRLAEATVGETEWKEGVGA